MKNRTHTYLSIGLGTFLAFAGHYVSAADSASGPTGGGYTRPPAITPPPIVPPPGAQPHHPPYDNAVHATTGLPPGAMAAFIDTANTPATQNATPPAGTTVAGKAIQLTGIQDATAPVGLKLPGAAPGLKVGRLNEALGIWEVVGAVEKNGKFYPSNDGIYTILK